MAWEENSRICLHTQLIAILSRIGVIIEKIPPKGESFSDFIATFAMSVGFDTYFDLQHKDR